LQKIGSIQVCVQQDDPQENGHANRLILVLIIGYLVVRILVINIIEALVNDPLPNLVTQSFELGLYIIIVIMILQGKNCLSEFNIDKYSLVLFIVFEAILRTGSVTSMSIIYFVLFLLASIYLVLSLRKSHPNLKGFRINDLDWTFIGLLSGFVFSFLIAIPGYLQSKNSSGPSTPISILIGAFLLMFINSFSHSAALEEPVFRGFLWGYLSDRGWTDKKIWLFQAGLFWLAHIKYIGRPYTFLITAPLIGLLLGFLAWKSRSIAPSMIAHATYNAFKFVIDDLFPHIISF
jgi:membrane protease YdiL (CAAX protease family)